MDLLDRLTEHPDLPAAELQRSLRAARAGTFSIAASGEAVWEGYPHPLAGGVGRFAGRVDELLVRLGPDERRRLASSLLRAALLGHELSLRVPVGSRWVHLRGRRTEGAKAVLSGVCGDVTDELCPADDQRRGASLQAQALLRLAQVVAHPEDDLAASMRVVTETAARALGVDRASVWAWEPEQIRCIDAFDVAEGSHAAGQVVPRTRVPAFTEHTHSSRVIAVEDVASDARMVGMTGSNLTRVGVTAVLDAPVRLGGEVVAFVCNHVTGGLRRWTSEEQSFAASVADLVALLFEGQRRRAAEAALEQQRAFLRQVIDESPNLIYARDRQGRFTLVNRAAAEVYGTTVEGMIGKSDSDFNPNADEVAWFRKLDLEVLETGEQRRIPEEVVTDASGQVRWLQTVKLPLHDPRGARAQVLGVSTDITARKHAEEERSKLEASLRQAQRLESIGLLAGGLAHDFNNLLTPILALSHHLEGALDFDSTLREDARDIAGAARRARDLIAQLMALGRCQVLQVRALDLNAEIVAAQKILARVLPESIAIVLALAPGRAPALVDPTQIQQVLINLAANARDAMPGGGSLTITTELEAEMVRIVVADTGGGIPADVLPNIFDPFFTTKEVGRGTGLGLATVYGIVKQHRGTIEVDSDAGKGTRFIVRLPRAAGLASAAGATPGAPAECERCRETVLVVEDEEMVRKLVVRVLKHAGFTVLAADCADGAMELAAAHRGPIHLLLTDVVMPHGDGVALAGRIRAARPASKVLFMSGHAHEILGHHGVVDEGTPLLRKPFVPADLTAAVRRVLDG